MNREPIPRLPVFGWQAFGGARASPVPCLLSQPNIRYTTSGRASILLALETLEVGQGDKILLPTYHCPTMVAPAVHLNAQPVFYPLDEHGAPCMAWLDQQDLGRARALLAAHYFGLPQPMHTLRQWCDNKGIALIEDCAHALFGRSGQRPIGAWGDLAIASLTKFLPMPEGGCMVVNGSLQVPELAPCTLVQQLLSAIDILEVGATQGRLPGLNFPITSMLGALRRLRSATHQEISPKAAAGTLPSGQSQSDFSIDSRTAHRDLTGACRWVARAMPRGRVVAKRRANYELLARHLSGHNGFRPLLAQLPPDCAPYVFPLWVDQPDPGYQQLRSMRMPVFRWDRLWPSVPDIEGDHGRQWSHHIVQLACHQDLSGAELDQFVRALQDVYGMTHRMKAR